MPARITLCACLPSRVPYESINTEAGDLKTGKSVRLSGYGCATIVGVGPKDGIYRIGLAPITALPGDIEGEPNTIITVASTVKDALLCRGDSGGPGFIESEMSLARKTVSVNSRVWPETEIISGQLNLQRSKAVDRRVVRCEHGAAHMRPSE
jgi:hypothetical protein